MFSSLVLQSKNKIIVDTDSIDYCINQLNKTIDIAGLSILLIKNDSVVYSKCFGYADRETKKKVKKQTLFRVGSISKLFVGLSVLKLVEEGKLNLKDKIGDIIPEIKIDNPWKNTTPIRVENLIEHTSGLGDWSMKELAYFENCPKSLFNSLMLFPKSRVLHFEPSTQHQYSNIGLAIAAFIVERIAKMNYYQYVKENFFIPLKMKNSNFFIDSCNKNSLAKGYYKKETIPFIDNIYKPSTSLISNVEDLKNLLLFFLNKGSFNGKQILSKKSIESLHQVTSFSNNYRHLFKSIGVTNYKTYFHTIPFCGHGGSIPGYNANFQYNSQYKFGFVILSNNENPVVESRVSTIIKYFLTKDIKKSKSEIHYEKINDYKDISGYYMPQRFKFDFIQFIKLPKTFLELKFRNDTLLVINSNHKVEKYVPTHNNIFRSLESEFHFLYPSKDFKINKQLLGSNYLFQISKFRVMFSKFIFYGSVLLIPLFFILSLLYISLSFFMKSKQRVMNRIVLYSNISPILFILLIILLNIYNENRYNQFLHFGTLNFYSISIFFISVFIPLATFFSIYFLFKKYFRKESRFWYWLFSFYNIFLFLLIIYLVQNKLVGTITWL